MPILIKRFRVVAGGKPVFDEVFSSGVNIIEGENSSGKTTLVKLLYHGLGGTVQERQWSKAAKLCDRVFCELHIGRAKVTMSRRR